MDLFDDGTPGGLPAIGNYTSFWRFHNAGKILFREQAWNDYLNMSGLLSIPLWLADLFLAVLLKVA